MNKSELKELMALLPSNITKSKEFTTKTKMVIAQLILMNGMDKVKNDGYFFVTNKKLVEELGITEKTIIKILRNLEEHNFITRKSGKRGEASEYIVNEEIIKSFGNTVKKHCNTVKENTVINYSNDLENTVLNYSNKINSLILIINDLVKSNQELIDKVNQLEITVLNYSNKISNYSTDTESDKDIEIDKEIENINYNINNNILNKIEEKEINVPLEQYNEIDLNNKIHNSKFEIKEVNLNKIEILEIEENLVNMDNLENVKNKFYFNLNLLIKKMKGLTKEEIKQKLVLLNNWIKNHSYFKFLQENEMNDELDNITSIVEQGLKEIRKEMKNDITVTSTPLEDINTSTDENNTSTLEEIKTIESYSTPNSLFNTSSTSSTDDLDYSEWDKEKYQFPWNDPECERRKQQYQQTHYIKTDVYYI